MTISNEEELHMALNQCTFLGRLTREPDIRYTAETQMPIARFTLAVGRETRKENETDADFITCVAFDRRAEFVERYLGKGIRIVVSGRMQNNNYTDKDGNRVYGMELRAEHIDFADGRNEAGGSGNQPESGQAASPARQNTRQAAGSTPAQGTANAGKRAQAQRNGASQRGAVPRRSAARPAGATGSRGGATSAARAASAQESFMNIPQGADEGLPFN